MSNNLKAGEFFGQVPSKRRLFALTLSEVLHTRPISVPKHSHELGHFQLLLQGSYLEHCGGRDISSRPMTISWHRPGITHRDEIGTTGGRFFMVEMHSRAIEDLQQFTRLPEDFYSRRSSLVWLGCRLYHEFKNWQVYSDLVAEGISLEMLAFAARRQLAATEKRPPVWLARVVEKLTGEFTENFSTEELASEAKVHTVRLAAVFRRFYHETMGEYVQKPRIARASSLLDKKIPLAEIAYAAGFADQSHFTRIFKRFVGVTPGAFRNSL